MDQPPPPPPVKRLTLKLTGIHTPSFSATTHSAITPGGSMSTAMSPPPATPSGGSKKIKLVRKSQPATPADGVAPTLPSINSVSAALPIPSTITAMAKTQSGRQPKPSAKKRSQAESDDDVPLANGTSIESKPKKPKITLKPSTSGTGKISIVKVKQTGKIPHRPLGEGYDSEAEDREVDPVIEEQFLLRMLPGEHCEYIRWAINEKKIGISKLQGGADITMKFLDEEGRRAMLVVQGQPYAAILLDLPTITEGMKSWDKKSMVKSADICQVMQVFAKVRNEEEAKTVPLPQAVEHGHRWPHGITPPMHDARNRRFRKRLSKLEIQNKEAEVERLLAADKDAKSTRYEFVDDRTHDEAEGSGEEYEEEEEEEEEDADADGEADDYFGDADMGQQLDANAIEIDDALLEAEFEDFGATPGGPMELATPAVAGDVVTPGTANTGTPAAQTEESGAEANGADEESGDDDDDDDEEDDDGDDVDDGGDDERHDEVAGVKAEIATMKKQLAGLEEQLSQSRAPIMRKRIELSIKNLKSEITLKQSAIGEVEED
ncbi:hypothetical protein OQA88_1525 [Cercophora sp. LCS_1]